MLPRSSLGFVEIAGLFADVRRNENLLILVDQFEQLFRFADLAKQRDAGNDARLLLQCRRSGATDRRSGVCCITMRSDFLAIAYIRGLPRAMAFSQSQQLDPR